ncbi:MAG TPA: OmpA family protein [bacterium]|nr:OmpA family protein [bacterium]HQI49485.1 OmpA family protein [bacterium]HQJ64837.1 OmpA family protein [bacterium]
MRTSCLRSWSGPLRLPLLFILIAFAAATVFPQKAELYDVLFGEKDKQLKAYKNSQADLLSPNHYATAVENYARAKEDFKKGKETAEVRKRLTEVETAFKQMDNTLWTGKAIFEEVLKAREDALNARAPEFALEDFNAAEELLRAAGAAQESADTQLCREKANRAKAKFRESELNAIKKSIMTPAHAAIAAALKAKADKYAPKTCARAKELLTLADEILNSNRYAVSEATSKAEKAIYEAQHALRITDLLQTRNLAGEDLILLYEEGLAKVTKELGYDAPFDQPVSEILATMAASVKSLREDKQQLGRDLQEKQEQLEKEQQAHAAALAQSKKQIEELTARSESNSALAQQKQTALQEELTRKQAELKLKEEKEARLAKIRQMFLPEEAKVLLEGNHLIIRLQSLSFPVGKAVIQPGYFGLLSRVQRAIREYPEAKIVIEGHTDSSGDERYNESLSSKRAEAVRLYILSNMVLAEDQIDAVGYGESRPVASNDTEEGRAQNRRIDVILTIE